MFLFKTVGRVIDRDIIFRDRTCIFFLGCVVKFQACESWQSSLCAFSLSFFSFLFLFLPAFSIFSPLLLPLHINALVSSRSNAQTREVRSREKAERTQRAVRRFTRFVDYGLMFDSRRSFSLEYKLIRSPYKKSLEL